MYKTLDGKFFATEAEVLADHDEGEELHAFIPSDPVENEPGEAGWTISNGHRQTWQCKECGDTEEGLMHNNTDRNIEPLLAEDN